MKSFQTSIDIDAPCDKVWAKLIEVSTWPAWNTTVTKVEGRAELGGKVTVYTKLSPKQAFPLRVTAFEPCKKMVWTGGMPLGLFTGQRTYTLTSKPNGKTQFEMVEQFSGLMAPLITRSIPDLQPSFDEFASCLKTVAEK